MTAPHRSLLVFTVAFMLPACLHVDATPYSPQPDTSKSDIASKTDQTRKTSFAELLSRPGVVVPVRPSGTAPLPQQPVETEPSAIQVTGDKQDPPASPPAPNPGAETPLLKAVRAFTEGRPDQAIEFLSALDKPNQDLLLSLLPVLEEVAKLDSKRDPVKTAMLADQLRSAAASLEPRAALRLEAVSLCRMAAGYGRYDPCPKGVPYRPNDQALLYIEVRNLISQPSVGPRGETYLTSARETVEIRDAYGKLVDQLTRDGKYISVVQAEKRLFTRTPIHEFHILYEFRVPSAPGVYAISMNIQDPVGRRSIKTEPIEFTVAGP